MRKPWIYTSIFAGICYLMLTSTASALTPYQPEVRVEIMTEVTADHASGDPTIFSRIFAGPVQKISDACYTDFYNITSDLIGRLNFATAGIVSWEGTGGSVTRFQADNLCVMPGLSIPVDVLPVNQLISTTEPVVFDFHRKVGGRVFKDRIEISVYSVTIEQAQQEQWIRFMKKSPKELKMIEAKDLQTGQLIVKQLWAIGSGWWLYEQTLFRRSWRIK